MKKLFLSSYFAFVADKLHALLPAEPRKLKLLIIPTAANIYKVKPWFYGDKLKLKLMGFQMKNFDLTNKTRAQVEEACKGIDAVFVSGGNTYYLLDHVQKSGFAEVITPLIEKGVMYIGSSAGSALACPTIEYIEDLDDKTVVNLSSFEGLHLTKNLILPHYGEAKYESKFQNITAKWSKKGFKVTTLTNNQVYIVDGKKHFTVGV